MSNLLATLGAVVEDVMSWLRWHRPKSRCARLVAELEARVAELETHIGALYDFFKLEGRKAAEEERVQREREERRSHLTLHHGGAA